MEAERSRAILIGVRVAEQPVVWTMGGKGVRATTGAKKRGEEHGRQRPPYGRECTSILTPESGIIYPEDKK